jgi:hypothetical protein
VGGPAGASAGQGGGGGPGGGRPDGHGGRGREPRRARRARLGPRAPVDGPLARSTVGGRNERERKVREDKVDSWVKIKNKTS